MWVSRFMDDRNGRIPKYGRFVYFPMSAKILSSGGNMSDTCQECGAKIEGGTGACCRLLEEFLSRTYTGSGPGSLSMVVFDAYCMQHLAKYCASAKSYLAHLTRLYIGVEKDQNPYLYRKVFQKLDGNKSWPRPSDPSSRGSIILPDIYDDLFGPDGAKTAHEYALSVWTAYEEQHNIAVCFLED